MARWLFDTDVLLDVVLNREPHAELSRAALGRMQQGYEDAFVAWHTVSNLHYNATRERNAALARDFITDLLDFAEVAPTSTEDLRYALTLPMTDFEDAMQAAAAHACEARFIVTRNVRDFSRSPIPSITPAAALAELSR